MSEKVLTNHEITNREVIYDGQTKIEEVTINNGGEEYKREVIKLGNFVGAIIKDVVKDKYIFVEQHRTPVDGVMVEIVAGKIEEGEKPEQALKREIMEETGYKVDFVNHLYDFFTSPGRCDEICSLFYVEVSEQVHEGGGIGNEDIKIVEVSKLGLGGRLFFKDPFDEIKEGEETTMLPPYQLIDAKSMIAVMWMENANTLKGMSEVITQAKIRSL